MSLFASIYNRLASSTPVRALADWAMTRVAHRRVAALNRRNVECTQQRVLLSLVEKARRTRFGKDHGFERIRSVADYQQRVPLRTYEQMWDDYWRGPFPYLKGVSWPDPIPYFALSSGTTTGTTKYIPLSWQMLASNQKAALTTLSMFLHAYPGTPLLAGRLFFLGGSTDLVDLTDKATPSPRTDAQARRGRILGGDLSGITSLEASMFLRPYAFPPVEMALMKDWEQKMTFLARESASLPISMLSGIPAWMLVLFDRLRQITGKERIADIWPGLRLVIHGGTKFDPYRDLFRKQIGGDAVRFTEVYPASEGYIATQDHRYDLLRLIPDHGLFYEFVPVDELDDASPTRHTVETIETGVNYAIVLTTCAGVWSYVLGDTVIFESRRPPLLRFSGRTKYFLSAFGEHLISEEVEKAVTQAATATGSAVVDFHVGPVFPEAVNKPGRHVYFVEFADGVPNLGQFAAVVDDVLNRINEDYQAHRQGDLTMLSPEIVAVKKGGFADWMRSRGKLGGQHKVPRMDNSGTVTDDLRRFFGGG